jgi:PAS domain S-box-containing protein
LLSNAFKFTLKGRIEVTIRHAERVVELMVRDTGTGIPPDQMPHLFERFHRVEGTWSRTQEGSGIGLALVRELVRLHGGDVRVESRQGEGSTFRVTLPLGTAHLPQDRIRATRTLASTALGAAPYVEEAMRWLPDWAAERLEPTRASLGDVADTSYMSATGDRPRILLADDNADMRDYIRRLLAGRYDVMAVADGIAAREAARQHTPDLVLSDVMMPGLDGFGLLREVRTDPRTQGLPFILLSARAGEEARVEGLQAGADDYLTKPFSAKELLAQIASALEIARLRREALAQERRLLAEMEEQRNWLRVTLSSIGDAVIATDNAGRVSFLNPVAEALIGWPQDEARGRFLEEVFDITNETTGQPVENPVAKVLQEGRVVGLANHTILAARDGTKRPIDDSAAPIRGADGATQGVVLIFRDVTEQKRSEAVLAGQKRVLELIVQGASLPDVLDALCEIIERQSQDKLIATVLLINEDGHRLRSVAGRRAPDDYARAVDGVAIGPCVGSCGTAAYRAETVVVSDIATDPLWANFRDLALGHGLRSCWSTPIFSSQGTVLGTFAVYSLGPRDPSPNEFRLVDLLTRTAAVAIERRRAEEALQEASATLRSFYDTAPVMMGVVEVEADRDEVLHVTDNTATGQFFGVNPESLSQRRASEMGVPQDHLREWVRRYRESECTGQPVRFEYQHVTPGGTRWLSVIVFCIERLPGGRSRCSYVAEDVTERKRVEVTLRKQSERLRLLWEAATILLTTDDPDAMLRTLFGKIAPHFALDTYFNFLVNESGDGLCLGSCAGIPEDEVRKITRLDYGQAVCGTVALHRQPIVATHIQESDEPMVQLVKGYGVRVYACNPLVVEGQLLGTLSFASRTRDEFDTDELEFLGTICRYVTVAYERLRLVQQLRDQDRRKDEFLATLAHELRNPLAPIRNALQILKMPRLDTTTVERSREMMERQVHQLVRLVDDLLDVSRVMRGKVELRKEKLELATVVARAVETVQPLIESQGHELIVSLSPESLPLDGDPVRLAQVVGNLLTNAAKYTQANGRIWLTGQRVGDDAVLRVRDTGIGIAPDMLPHIFELFVQVDHASTRSQGGLGIGLTLVKNLVEMHHGTVEAHSAGLGRGSEFVVRLPLMLQAYREEIEDDNGEEQQEPLLSSGHRLLVVDDNRDAAESLAMLVRLQGHEVRVAHDGTAALEMVKDYRPALVFLDIGMPKMDGYEVARRLRQQPGLENIRLAALTGWGQQEDRRRTAEAGFDHHLVKPLEPKALERLLADLQLLKS